MKNIKHYKFTTDDYEQISSKERPNSVLEIGNSLRKMPPESFIRLFALDGGYYLDSNWEKINIHTFHISESDKTGWGELINGEVLRNDLVPHEGTLYCNNRFIRFIRIESLGSSTKFNELLNISPYVINIRKISQLKAKRDLDLSRKQSFASNTSHVRDIEQENAFIENEALLEAVINGDEDLFEYEAWFIVKEVTSEAAYLTTETITNALEMKGHKYTIETFGIESVLDSIYRDNEPKFELSNFGYKSMMPNLLPLHTDTLDNEGIAFQARSGEGLKFNLFDPSEQFYNSIIVGPPGSGKSFVCCYICKEEFKKGAKVVIADRGGSYKKLAESLGGTVFPEKFNPLFSKNPTYLREMICSMIPEREFSKENKGKLLLAIKKLDLNTIDSMGKLILSLEVGFPSLKYYFSDIEDSFTNNPISIADFNYIDLQIYPEAILPLLLVVLIELIESIKGKKILVLDECHYLLERNPSFVETKFRELRKHMGAPIALTQDYSDFLATKIGSTIAKCTNNLLAFNHQLSTSEYLTDFDVQMINSTKTIKRQYSEFYIKKNSGKKKVVRYYPSSEDYKTFTSDYMDNSEFIKFKRTPIGELLDNSELIELWKEMI